ncbi:MAG: tetratricopeptide repeat protein [Candidatus Cloacimonetes bacterium]|nr:tetratricopeptide repeat protein [Candidatus Cloacimonadota bacterium]
MKKQHVKYHSKNYRNMSLLFFVISFIFSTLLYTIDETDSLKIEYEKSSQPDKAYIAYELAIRLANIDLSASLEYLDLSKAYYEKTNNDSMLSYLESIYSWVYSFKGDNKSALQHANNSLILAEKSKNKLATASAYDALGSVFYDVNNYAKALEYYLEAKKINEVYAQDSELIANYNNLGLIYKSLGNFEKSLFYFQKCVDYLQEINDENNLSVLNSNIADLYLINKEYDKALEHFFKSLEYDKKTNLDFNLAITLHGIGDVYLNKGDLLNAEEYFQKSYELFSEEDHKLSLVTVCLSLAELYLKTSEYEKALNNIKESEAIAVDMELDHFFADINLAYYKYYKVKKNSQKALFYYEKYMDGYKDIYNKELTSKISETQVMYDLEKIEREMTTLRNESRYKDELLKKNRLTKILLISIILLFCISLTVLIVLLIKYHKKTISLNQQKIALEESYISLQEAQEKMLMLERKNSALAMAVTANHELNQPLMILQGNLEMFKMSIDKDSVSSKQIKYIAKMIEAIDRISKLLHTYKTAEDIQFLNYSEETKMVFLKEKNEENNIRDKNNDSK